MSTDHHGQHAHGSAAGQLSDLREPTIRLRRRIPEAFQAFLGLSDAAMADGALSAKHKELIALALAVSQHCDGCIAYHARGAARRGATEPEVAEALAVTIVLGGGPAASDYAPRALEAFREFAGSD